MITGINYLRIFSVIITDWETNFTDLQANDFGNLGKNNSGNILVGNHAVIFTEINSPRCFFSVGNVCVENGTRGSSRCPSRCAIQYGYRAWAFPYICCVLGLIVLLKCNPCRHLFTVEGVMFWRHAPSYPELLL